jgi:hypothetical protein
MNQYLKYYENDSRRNLIAVIDLTQCSRYFPSSPPLPPLPLHLSFEPQKIIPPSLSNQRCATIQISELALTRRHTSGPRNLLLRSWDNLTNRGSPRTRSGRFSNCARPTALRRSIGSVEIKFKMKAFLLHLWLCNLFRCVPQVGILNERRLSYQSQASNPLLGSPRTIGKHIKDKGRGKKVSPNAIHC